jgi:TRAP-type C4-dicarboxylate transport system permease small subunit
MRLAENAYRALEAVSARALSAAGWCYLAMTLIICFDIFARRLLGFSTEATSELTGYLLAVGMTWGLAGTLFERAHVRIDVLVQRLPIGLRVWLHLLALATLLLAAGFFVFGSMRLALYSWELGATDLSGISTPLALPQGLWAAGFVLLWLAVLALGARSLRLVLDGRAEQADAALAARSYEDEAQETLEAVGSAESKQ